MSSYQEKYDRYFRENLKTHDARAEWFRNARFGLFIHYGLFAVHGMCEWAQLSENRTIKEYEALTAGFCPKPGCTDEWCRMAVEAGAKYAVLTTRHHEGFSLWNSRVNPFNSMNSCGRDIVAEFCASCRKYGLRIGLYSSLMDWHHPDGWRCMNDPAARRRFLDYIEALNVELLSNYGRIDILWYDMPWPQMSAEEWESVDRNSRLRQLQPDILINNRSRMPEDFYTPEETLNLPPADAQRVEKEGADWEACLTFNGLSWGYLDPEQAKPYTYSAQRILALMQKCAEGGGNLLLNIGPAADGSVPEDVVQPLKDTGAWLGRNGEAVYGRKTRRFEQQIFLNSVTKTVISVDRKTVYAFNAIWPKGGTMSFGGLKTVPKRITYLADGREIPFRVFDYRLELYDLPEKCPDPQGITVLKLEFDAPVRAAYGCYYPQMTNGVDYSDGKGNP